MPSGDAPDIAALLERYERPLVRYAHSILGDLDGARDVVQETFIRLVQLSAPTAEGADAPAPPPTEARHLEAWLFTVCRNRAIDHQRKHSRIIPMPFPDDTRPSDAPDPAACLEQSDTAHSLFRLLDQLTPNQREVIRLKFQNDLSYKEIAEITQLSVTNVGFLIHTGLKKLRALLQESTGDQWAAPMASTEV